jgi:hypothetical protein
MPINAPHGAFLRRKMIHHENLILVPFEISPPEEEDAFSPGPS